MKGVLIDGKASSSKLDVFFTKELKRIYIQRETHTCKLSKVHDISRAVCYLFIFSVLILLCVGRWHPPHRSVGSQCVPSADHRQAKTRLHA